MKKNLFIIPYVLLIILSGSCEKENGNNNEKSVILYPEMGDYGDNIIQEDSIQLIGTKSVNYPVCYSLRAELPENTSLKLVWKKTSDTEGVWFMDADTRTGWSVDNYNSGVQIFKATGPVVCEQEMYFHMRGSADIEIYENSEPDPSRVKTIEWEYIGDVY